MVFCAWHSLYAQNEWSLIHRQLGHCTLYIVKRPLIQWRFITCTVTLLSVTRYQWENTSAHKGISQNYHSIRWSPMNIELLNTYYNIAPLSMQCNQSDGSRFPVSKTSINIASKNSILLKMHNFIERLCIHNSQTVFSFSFYHYAIRFYS